MPAGDLTVGTLNVWGRWADWPRRLAALRACFPDARPDVLLLQEVRRDAVGDQAQEIAEELGYPEHVAVEGHHGDEGAEGLAILSRLPLHGAHAETMPASDPTRRVLVAYAETPRGLVNVVCAHTVAVPEDVRRRQVDALLARSDTRLVIGADLNDTPDAIGPLLDDAGLRDALDGAETPTWPMNELTFGEAWERALGHAPQFSLAPRRLDYLLSRGLDVVAAGVDPLQLPGGAHASDHALVWARYAIGDGDGGPCR